MLPSDQRKCLSRMIDVSEVHFRVTYLVVAVCVLSLLRRPLRNRENPGSTWFAVAVGSVSVWLACVGLYYFVDELWAVLALYNTVLLAITVCFFSWLLIAIEFATGKRPPRSVLVVLGVLAIGYFLVLWTNYFWLHELVYRASGTFVDDGGGFNTGREPLFWVHMVVVYVIVFASSAVFVAEWLNASGPRKQQAGILAVTPAVGVVASLLWFAEVLRLPFDPTPVGVTVSIVLLGWALYRTEFLDITPVATRTVVEEMPDAVVIFDDRDRVVEWNRAARTLFSVEDPSVGMTAASFFESVSSDVLAQLVGPDRPDSQISIDLDGRPRQFSVSRFSITPDQTPIGHVVVLRDVSDLKQREMQLLAQNERLEEFTDIVSHDLQGPLMEIRGSANMTISTGDVTHVDRVVDATDRIDELVTDLLRLARTGRQLDAEVPVELDEVARRAWSHVWSPSAELVVETDRVVLGDPNRIQQLFENVFRNSVEHGTDDGETDSPIVDRSTPSSSGDPSVDRVFDGIDQDLQGDEREADDPSVGERKLSSDDRDEPLDSDQTTVGSSVLSESHGAEPPDTVRISVGPLQDGFYIEDDGAGIPQEERPRVFEKGYTNTSTGTGIGLSIVRQIVDAHGWSIQLTDGATGGARFEITGVDFESHEDRNGA
ncbi:histidine kinase N-terminal 7TM domain-containing protein [Natronoglomus mannanivorans]